MSLAVPDPLLGPWAKAFPPRLWGTLLSEAAGARLSEFSTPVFAVTEPALAHNERVVFDWARASGVLLAPHGKTTMAPALWQRLLDAGAWGITVATPWQAEVAADAGVSRILLANSLTDAAAARRLAALPVAFSCWADSVDTVTLLAEATDGGPRLDVLVELGGAEGRTGARTIDEGEAIARAIADVPSLRLAGVAGYEGPFGSDRSPASVAAVDAYLAALAALHGRLSVLYEPDLRPIVTAGGSSWPDRVVHALAGLDADVVVRSGAFQIHDDGFYSRMSPFGRDVPTERLRSAMHVWARVVSRPEPGLALLDAGRRDVPFDIDLPVPQIVVGRGPLTGARITALNDQHAFLRFDVDDAEDGVAGGIAVGDVVRLGLSHPCTAFDKWRAVPLIDDPDADDPLVVGAVATCF